MLTDPRHPLAAADRQAMADALVETNRAVRSTNDHRQRLGVLLDRLDMVLETLEGDESLQAAGGELRAQAVALMEGHFTGPECQGLCRGNPTGAAVTGPHRPDRRRPWSPIRQHPHHDAAGPPPRLRPSRAR